MVLFDVLFAPFPDEAHNYARGLVDYDEEKKRFNIAVDTRQSEEQQLFTLKHEFAHIMVGHVFGSDKPITIRESEADDYANKMTDSMFESLLSLSNVVRM